MQIGARGKSLEKTRGSAEGPLDYLLMPPIVHRRISRKVTGLAGAFLLVGVFDVILSRNLVRDGFFTGGMLTGAARVGGLLGLSLLLGAIDVFCVMWPIADFARLMARVSERFISGGIRIILMKSYALTYLFIVPPTALLVYNPVDWNTLPESWSATVRLEFLLLTAIIAMVPLLQLGIVFRTLSIRSKLQLFPRLLVLAVMFIWMRMAGELIQRISGAGIAWLATIGAG